MLIFLQNFCGKASTAQLNLPLFLLVLSADVTHLYKKGKNDQKDNCRPVSILPTRYKCFEKCMFSRMSAYFDEIFSKYQYGSRKGCSTRQCLLALLAKWKTAVDKGKVFGALLTELSMAFDCLNHEFLIAKLNVHVFSLPALVHDYLSERKQRTGVNNPYSTSFEILFGVPQGSILASLLFNTFLADLFFSLNKIDIGNYRRQYANAKYNDVNGPIKSLQRASKEFIKWFNENLIKINPDKCHLLVSTNDNVAVRIGNFQIENTKREKLLGIQFENANKLF